MGFMILKPNGKITNSIRVESVRNENILQCLTEKITLSEDFTLHSVYLMLQEYPILCNILDTPDRMSPVKMSPVAHFKSFFKDYNNEFLESNFLKTAYIHQIVMLSKSNYKYNYDIENIRNINKIKPEKIAQGFKYGFENQYEFSLNYYEAPSPDNDFCRYALSKKDIDAMSHLNPIKIELGNILFFYSDSRLTDRDIETLVKVQESASDAIDITLLDFLETIVSRSVIIQ